MLLELNAPPEAPRGELDRSLSTLAVTVYGIGTIVGAGIFVLLGKLIGVAGSAAPMVFLLAAAIAGLTGLSYAQLAARLPYSAGEAVYVEAAFGRPVFTLLIGLAVAGSGILSAATIAHGFNGYLNVWVATPPELTAGLYLLALGAVAIAGIRETAWLVGFIAFISIVGLVFVAAAIVMGDTNWQWPSLQFSITSNVLPGLLLGAFLAIYALIGFEDMVNLAEEIRDPGRSLRIAIPIALGISTLLYVGLTIVALGAAPVEALARSDAPIAFLLDDTGLPGQSIIVVLSIVAITNGALAQLVMAARVLYGMAQRGYLPAALATINSATKTPVTATLFVLGLVILASSIGGLLALARGTSTLVLLVFATVNMALLTLHWREGQRNFGKLFVPALAAAACLLLLASELLRLSGLA